MTLKSFSVRRRPWCPASAVERAAGEPDDRPRNVSAARRAVTVNRRSRLLVHLASSSAD
jgi:hypothetical protein